MAGFDFLTPAAPAPGLFDWRDPDAGLAAASSMPSPALLQYTQDVLSGKVAAGGALGQNNYDPNRSFAQNALDPRAIEQATDVAFGIGPGAIRAYHGSPHSFDRFDLSKIGTGEGAQAYGHGLYFAENEGVARGYRDTLAGKAPLREYGGQPLETSADWYGLIDRTAPADWRLAKIIDAAGKQGGIRSALNTFEPHTRNASDGPLWAAAIERFKEGVGPAAKGHMYEVDIHADPKAFLDWDKPLSAQPKIDDVLYDTLTRAGMDKTQLNHFLNNKTGREGYERLILGGADPSAPGTAWAARGGAPIASATLREAGIPGIRYLDQGSRIDPIATQQKIGLYEGLIRNDPTSPDIANWANRIAEIKAEAAKPQTSNYAIFDPSIIEILRKYGILPPLAAGGALGFSQQPPPGS